MSVYRMNRVEDVMSTAVLSMRESDSIGRVRREMKRAGVHHMPIVDAAQHVVGIISTRDLDATVSSRRRAGDVMTRGVSTARLGDDLVAAVQTMRDLGVRSLPVVGDDEQLVGIVTSSDCRRPPRAA
jgi:CBS domain-containing protein